MVRGVRPLLIALALVGCSNACPSPVPLCNAPHPDYCPCLLPDMGRPDAFVPPNDAFVDMTDAGADDAAAIDDAGADDTGTVDDASAMDAAADDASDDAG